MAQERDVPKSFWARVQKMIDDSIRKALSAPVGGVAVTGKSGIAIKNGGRFIAEYPSDVGGVMAYVGDLYFADGSYAGTGWQLQQPDGTLIASFRTDTQFGFSRSEIYDSAGRVIFGNDGASQMGLARPYLPLVFYPAQLGVVPQTQSATFTPLWRATTYKQQPRVTVSIGAALDTAGATGELRVMVNGVQMGATQPVTSAAGSWTFGPSAVDGDHMSVVTVEIQARRTSATGTLYAVPQVGSGLQS